MHQHKLDSHLNSPRLSAQLIWWVGMLAICIVPFMSSWRTGTLSSFYLDAGSLFFAVALFGLTVLTQKTKVRIPVASVGLLLLALLLMLQARIMRLPYTSQSDLAALVFIIFASLAWCARAWVIRIGQTQAVTIMAFAILIGVLLQTIVCALQFAGVAGSIPGVLPGPGNHYIYGQLAQRNHLGHYLMWGVLALCYLWHQRRLSVWLVIPLLLWFTGIMGLIGSRTIIAYVVLIAISLLFWRWRNGKTANRFLTMLAIGIALVLLFQFILSPLFQWLWHIHFESGTSRLEQGGFAMSGRRMEWHKAWLIFKSAPWFGYGWGSYSYQGFAIEHVYPLGFREYETSVLFTHCHNLILQLLAETGLVGLLIVIGCFFYAIWPFFSKDFNPSSILLVSLILVSLCHSMLEYPLWYAYFLAVFVLCIALTPVSEKQQQTHFQPFSQKKQLFWGMLALITMLLIFHQMILYQQFIMLRASHSSARTEQMIRMQHFRKRMYFMRYYIDMAIIEQVNAVYPKLPAEGKQAALLTGRYRPYSNTLVRGFYLAQEEKIGEAKEWFDHVSQYYPYALPDLIRKVKEQPKTVVLKPHFEQVCDSFNSQKPYSFKCM